MINSLIESSVDRNDAPIGASIITGGGRGIGRSISLRLAVDGPAVVVGRTESDLESVRSEIVRRGGTALACVGDVADEATATKCVSAVTERGWVVRNLVCNAGIGKSGPSETFDFELWRRIFDVNVHAPFRFIQACLPSMLQQGRGAVCLMSSTAGFHGLAFDAAYSASKHAVIGLARSLANEYGKRGLTFVPICPGFVESEMTDRAIQGLRDRRGASLEDAVRKIAGTNSTGRIIPAEELAEAVALICSGKLPSLNGNPLILGGKA